MSLLWGILWEFLVQDYCHKDGLDEIGGKDVHHCNVRYENKNSSLAENAIITTQVVILFLVNIICN